MKNKLLTILVVMIIVTFAGYNVYHTQNVNSFSKIALANLEALSESNEIKLRPFPVDENVTETKEVTSNGTWMIRKGTRRCPNSSSIEYTCKPGQFEDKTFIPFK